MEVSQLYNYGRIKRADWKNAEFRDFEELGFSADAKEAVLIAFLANELLEGGKWELGKVSF